MEFLKGKRIAIYGTGSNAKVILKHVKYLKYICVISEEYSEKYFCDYPVVSLDVAIELVDVILIAAVPTSTAIIYSRISERVPSNVEIYDMRGHKLNTTISVMDFLQSISIDKNEKKYTDLLCEKFKYTATGKLYVDSFKCIAYLIAPITIKFMQYILLYAKKFDYLLFASRDGYFLQKLYNEYIEKETGKWAKGIYLYTSRQALENAYKCEDRTYTDYLASLELNGKCAVIDIVTQGSVCNGIFNLTGYMPDLIALGTTAIPNKYIQDEKKVHSMLGNINQEIEGIPFSFSDFSELHLFLEILYASKDGQFIKFTEENMPVFEEESEYNGILISNVQKELIECINEMMEYGFEEFSDSYVMKLLNLFYKKYSFYDEKLKEMFIFDDPYDERLRKCNLIDKLGW